MRDVIDGLAFIAAVAIVIIVASTLPGCAQTQEEWESAPWDKYNCTLDDNGCPTRNYCLLPGEYEWPEACLR